MRLTRRTFLELIGGSTAYAFSFSCTGGDPDTEKPVRVNKSPLTNDAILYFIDYTEWLFIHSDGSVTAHTGRIDMGQGLKTVLSNLISQALQLPPEKVNLVLGDTDSCPDDGPTEGSQATRVVGWGYWLACERIRDHLVERAARVLGTPVQDLVYSDGAIVSGKDPTIRMGIGELADGTVHVDTIDPTALLIASKTPYTDHKTPNVNGEAVVTGTLTFTADLFPGNCSYGALLDPGYHHHLTELESADFAAASNVSGVALAKRSGRKAMAVGESYSTVRRALGALDPRWKIPERVQILDVEGEIRAGAELRETIEEAGDPEREFGRSAVTLDETYLTQYASQVPIETETAVAEVEGDRATVWASTQAPFKARARVARRLAISEKNVRIVSMPVGGGFGAKVDTLAPEEAALLAQSSGRRVKHVYSREYQFNGKARYKEAVVTDIRSGVTKSGRLLARTIDLYQDEGAGTTETYNIPHLRTRLYRSDMPARHGTMRGTSFVQTCFAVESHTDMVADLLKIDPLEFRRKNLVVASFGPLLDACAEMIGYGRHEPVEGRGIGFAICHHGGRQLGAVAAEVSVNHANGEIRVERLAGAYDIGLVININTLTANTKGAMIWGLGFALFEEVHMDGHRSFTRSLSDYRIPRFSDVPPIEIAFLSNESKKVRPRGCGELPVVPTVGAIANAVSRATGVRFHSLPLTPERVLSGLRGDSTSP